jgi:O-antigen ligase
LGRYLYNKTSTIIVEGLLLGLLIFTPLAFGAVQTWSISVMEFAALLMVVVWLVGNGLSGSRERFRFPLAVPLLLFTGLVFAQMLPHLLGHKTLSEEADSLVKIGTVNFHATKTTFLKLLCYLGLYLCLCNTITSRKQITRVLTAVILIGFGVAFVGLLQRISGTREVLWWIKMPADRSKFMGSFINENHFAGYMELVIPLTIAYVFRYAFRIRESGWRGVLASEDLHKAFLLAFLVIIMIVALAVSESRGGLIGFLGSLVLVAVLLLSRRFHRGKAWIITALLILSFTMLAWIGLSGLLKRWGTLGNIQEDNSFKRRMEVAESTWNAARDYPVWGSGFGTFRSVFPNYGTLRYTRVNRRRDILQTTHHAENDYAQSLLETGWVGIGILFLGIVLFFRMAIRTYLRRRRRSVSMPAMGAAASVFAILVHSFSDFNMRIDSNAFLLVTIVAMVAGLSRLKSSRREAAPDEESLE